MMAIVDVVSQLPKGGPMAQVRGLGPRVGGRLALFCIRRQNRVYGAHSDFMDMLRRLPYRLSYHYYYFIIMSR